MNYNICKCGKKKAIFAKVCRVCFGTYKKKVTMDKNDGLNKGKTYQEYLNEAVIKQPNLYSLKKSIW